MQSDIYQLPVSNIAYHVYSRKEEQARMYTISQRAFQRTMDSYHEHEHLADLFQVELDKKELQRRERKEQDKLLKKKKSSKRSTQSHSQERPYSQLQYPAPPPPPPQPEPHSLHPQVTAFSALGISGADGVKIEPASDVHRTGELHGLKRARRHSDISSSEVSGYGDEELGHLSSGSKIAPLQMETSVASSQAGGNINRSRSNERSASSSPALPITPSPRVTPSDVRARNDDDSEQSSGMGSANRSSTQPESFNPARSLTLSTPPGTTASSILAPPRAAAIGRRKRKQAIPVNPSVVERMPGITLRIQRELKGSQLEVEILKNVDDYGWDSLSSQGPHSRLQAIEDIQKVEESIRSGRQPMTCHRRVSDWNRSLSTSLASLSWSTSNASSSTSLASIQDLIDARSLPLSWENFSTRECVVNKVIGKHDNDLHILEEVVQGTIARNQYNTLDLDEEQPRHRGREHEITPRASTTPTRRHSDASTGASTAAAAAAASVGGRSAKTSGTSAPTTTRTLPARATRSRTHVSRDSQSGKRGASLLVHDDLEQVLKHKRRRKLAERRRLGSKTSSKDGIDDDEEDEYDDEEGTQREEGRRALKVSKEMSEGDQEEEHEGGDVRMNNRGQQQRKRQLSWTDKGSASQDAHESPGKSLPEPADKRPVSRSGQEEIESSTTSSSSDVDNSEDDYLNSRERLARSRRRTKVSKGPSAVDVADIPAKPKARRKSESDTRTPLKPQHIVTTATAQESIAKGRRTKKAWGRGRNSRKEDEVGTTTDESSDDDGDLDGDEAADGEPLRQSAASAAKTQGTANHLPLMALSPSIRTRKLSSIADTPPQTPLSASSATGITLDSGGRTRGRGRSFSGDSSLQGGDKNRFFDLALDTMNQKRRDALAKKRAAKVEAKGREQREKADKERLEEAKSQKVEASNLPKSSKSLPGRVLRRTRMDGAAEEGSVDPDCTSCRMELKAADKDAWKIAQELGEIQLPKMWGVHAILCTTCRLQYLDHHSRCTACFYVPVMEEMAVSGSSCSRCKAGTWLTETVRLPAGESTGDTRKDGRRKTTSEAL
ncbi:hypothetical protein BGZ68_009929 [Mortierella alpina]|nr:hypothetical protein BGZ68_009929 [Mortierella alpina]